MMKRPPLADIRTALALALAHLRGDVEGTTELLGSIGTVDLQLALVSAVEALGGLVGSYTGGTAADVLAALIERNVLLETEER